MSTPTGVLGVLAMCWVYLPTLHSCKSRCSWAASVLCKVCKVYAHARARAQSFNICQYTCVSVFSHYARTKNPCTPYTPYTNALNSLILLGLLCVGFVLGRGFLCWVGSVKGEKVHDSGN